MHDPHAKAAPRPTASDRALRAGVVVGLAYVLIGWRGLLVPSMIRSVQPAFGQDDAGIGLYFLATAIAYGAGVLAGGRFVRARGERAAVATALAAMCGGLVLQGVTGSWLVFALLGVVVSLGASAADIGINALVLDLFPHARGRALNLLHVMYSAGALAAPLALAAVVGAGVAWQVPFMASGILAGMAAVATLLTVPRMPPGAAGPSARPAAGAAGAGGGADAADAGTGAGAGTATGNPLDARRLPVFLLVMALGTGCYVAAEAGVSDWLVRYLVDLPVEAASLALTLFWAGIAVARIVFARIGSRVDPLRAAAVLAPIGGLGLMIAFLLPVGPWTPALFAGVGFAFGPFFPLMVAAAGARLPDRSSVVATTLIFSAVVGAVVYPPAIGFISVAVGIQVAMVGTAVLAMAAGAAAWLSRGVRA